MRAYDITYDIWDAMTMMIMIFRMTYNMLIAHPGLRPHTSLDADPSTHLSWKEEDQHDAGFDCDAGFDHDADFNHDADF